MDKVRESTGVKCFKNIFKTKQLLEAALSQKLGRINAVNTVLWTKEGVLHRSHHQSPLSAFPALLCLPKGTIWSV